MNDLELLTEWINEIPPETRAALDGLPAEALHWQPDPAANSIAVTVWHYARWLDLLNVRGLQDRPQSEEQWFTRGWAARSGYDPSGLGLNGYGAITGYSVEDMQAMPQFAAADLLTYLDQVAAALAAQLGELPPAALHEPIAGLGRERSVYGWLKAIVKGGIAHLGEIRALRGQWERKSP